MHIKPFWYFAVEVVPVLWLPMSLVALWALPAWWRRMRRGDARPFLLLGWIALVLLFFSLSPGKRGVYILPALPALALALALAPLLPGLLRRPGLQRGLAVLSLLISAVLVLAAGWALLGQPSFAVRIELENGVAPWGWIFGVGIFGLAASSVFWRRGMLAFALLMLGVWTGYGVFGFPGMNAARSGAGLMQRAQAQLPADARLGLLRSSEQFLLQAQGDTRAFGFMTAPAVQRQRAYAWLRESPQHWLLLQHPHLDACIDAGQSIDLGWSNRRRWLLAPSAAFRTDCPQAPANTGAEVAPTKPRDHP
jgi:4-amino-4-deoxy-L-arabinose transferase-like glycosyltransferase